MKRTAVIFLGIAMMATAQTGRITGTVTDDTGAPIVGAVVGASLRSSVPAGSTGPGGAPLFLPVRAKAPTDAQGNYEIDGLFAATYTLCVDKPESTLLNPCLWMDQPVTVDLSANPSLSGVALTAARGVPLNIRVVDAKGLLSANPSADDVRVGTVHGKSPFIPALVTGRDNGGRTVTLVVPPGQAVNLQVSSATFALADGAGKAMAAAGAQIPVDVSAVPGLGAAARGGPPVVTVQVTGFAAAKP